MSDLQLVDDIRRTSHQFGTSDRNGGGVVEGVAVNVKPQLSGQPEEGGFVHGRAIVMLVMMLVLV